MVNTRETHLLLVHEEVTDKQLEKKSNRLHWNTKKSSISIEYKLLPTAIDIIHLPIHNEC